MALGNSTVAGKMQSELAPADPSRIFLVTGGAGGAGDDRREGRLRGDPGAGMAGTACGGRLWERPACLVAGLANRLRAALGAVKEAGCRCERGRAKDEQELSGGPCGDRNEVK